MIDFPLGYTCHARVTVYWDGEGWVHVRDGGSRVYVIPVELIHGDPAPPSRAPWLAVVLLIVALMSWWSK